MLLNRVKIRKNLKNSSYVPFLPTFNFLYLFFLLFSFLLVILSNILPVNNLLFKSILTQLNTFKINNIFFILISAVYICL